MNKIEIFEQELKNGDSTVGKVAILRGGLNTDNPTAIMNDAVSTYVGTKGYNEFIEVFLDNPWVRVVVSGINELDYKEFKNQKL
ncbi:hypothetical protein [Arcicella rigui]|uniref:Uncharacterized protein n=1 Tax=Arcicella rigui TaxID=797020 RepID=A0ABU5QH39_9BACT|nr:hypothetical protein [Arcicella rigui]MEA5141847.1 hypothetical protein [Arcicella rigui]